MVISNIMCDLSVHIARFRYKKGHLRQRPIAPPRGGGAPPPTLLAQHVVSLAPNNPFAGASTSRVRRSAPRAPAPANPAPEAGGRRRCVLLRVAVPGWDRRKRFAGSAAPRHAAARGARFRGCPCLGPIYGRECAPRPNRNEGGGGGVAVRRSSLESRALKSRSTAGSSRGPAIGLHGTRRVALQSL